MAKMELLTESPLISSLVHYEFQQAVWFKVWLHAQSQPLGLSDTAAQSVLAAFELDVEQGLWVVAVPDWESVVLGRNGWRSITHRAMGHERWIFCISPSLFDSASQNC